MFEQSEEEQMPCVMCGQHNEQMLMLGCEHDPCINCASIHYSENQPYNSAIYVCARCGQETQLDPSSVLELQRVYNLQKGKKRFNYPRANSSKRSKETSQDIDEGRKYTKVRAYDPVQPPSRTVNQSKKILKKIDYEPKLISNTNNYYAPEPVSKPSYFSNPKNPNYKSLYPCKDHAQQELTYFCFSCCKPICPQCAIHGSHKDHEVETTRKAIKKIRSLLNEKKQTIQAQASNLLNENQKGKKQQKQYAEMTLRDKDYLKQKISHLRNVLTEKQKQLLKEAEDNFNRNCQIIKMKSAAADSALNKITNCRKNIENTLKLDELAILQEFNKRDEEASSTLEKLNVQREKQEEYQLKYPPLSLDFDEFEDELDRLLQNIHNLKITSTQSKL